jgi:hypothetical protein
MALQGDYRKGSNMAEVMTFEQLSSRHPDEWAVIIEPEFNKTGGFASGLVLLHTSDRAAATELTLRIRDGHPSVICLSTTLKYLPTMQVIRDPDHPALKGAAKRSENSKWLR